MMGGRLQRRLFLLMLALALAMLFALVYYVPTFQIIYFTNRCGFGHPTLLTTYCTGDFSTIILLTILGIAAVGGIAFSAMWTRLVQSVQIERMTQGPLAQLAL